MLTTGYSSWLWLAFYFLSLPPCFAQSDATTLPGQVSAPQLTLQPAAPSPTFQSTLNIFLTNQQSLGQQFQTLVSQGATPQQIQAWQQQNITVLQTQQQLALNLAALSPVQPITYITDITLPQAATPELTNVIATQGDLYNRFAELFNNQLAASPATSVTGGVAAQFLQQNATEIQTQQQQSQVLAAQSNQQTLPAPPPLVIPPGSTPQMQAFLTLRDQLMRAQIQVQNQNVGSSAGASNAAMQQWMQQNAASFQQLQQVAQNLASTPTN